MGREKAARKAHGALKTQSFTGPGARQALGQSIKSKLHLSLRAAKARTRATFWTRRATRGGVGSATPIQGGILEVLDSFEAGVPEKGPRAAARRHDVQALQDARQSQSKTGDAQQRPSFKKKLRRLLGPGERHAHPVVVRDTRTQGRGRKKKPSGTHSSRGPGLPPYQNKDVVPSKRWNRLLRRGRHQPARRGLGAAHRRSDDPREVKKRSRRSGGTSRRNFGAGTCRRTTGGSARNARAFFGSDFTEGRSGATGAECNKGAKRLADEWKLWATSATRRACARRSSLKPVQQARKKKDAPAIT